MLACSLYRLKMFVTYLSARASPSFMTYNKVFEVNLGKVVISTECALMALDDNNPLSEKEMSAFKLTSQGMKTHDIATA